LLQKTIWGVTEKKVISITGTVSDSDGPLAGASVFVKGTTNGVVTDFDGRYTLSDVTSGATIVYSYVGYTQQEISYTNQTALNVILKRDLVSLDEVVIVSYGKQRNTPVSVIDGEELSEFPNTDIGQALQGRAANFNGNGVDTNWQDAYFRQAAIYNISANVNGGSEKARYNVGFSRLDQQGIFIDTGFSRTTLNINTDAKISDWLDIGQTLSLGHNRTVSPERDGGRDPFQNIIGMAPYIEVGNPVDGFGGTTELDLNDSRNQIRIQNSQDNLTRFSSAIGSVFVNAKIFDGLSFRSQFGLNASLLLQDNERRAFTELGTFANPINFVDKIRQTTTQTILTNTLAFDKDFGKHSVNASAVLEQTQINFESGLLSDNQEISSEIPEIFSPNASSLSFSVPENLNSVLFLAGYEFDKRYSISGSGRRDTSSRFSPENVPTVLNDVVVPGISPNNAANPDLRWETQIKQNYGFS